MIIELGNPAETERRPSTVLRMARVFVIFGLCFMWKDVSYNLVMIGTSDTRSSIAIKVNVDTHCDIVGIFYLLMFFRNVIW